MKKTYGKHKYTKSIVNGVRFWLIMVVLVSSFGPMLVSADVVWSDNFDDGNYDGWTIIDGNFSAANYYLECTGVTLDMISSIYHETNVSKGTWSFDCYLPSGDIYVSIQTDADGVGYSFIQIRYNRLSLWMRYPNRVANWESTFSETWTNISVTVDEDSIFDVFVDGIHRIHYANESTLTGNHWFFAFNSDAEGQAIDNVVVSDEVDMSLPFNTTQTTTTTLPETTTTSTTPTDGEIDMTMILLLGGGIAAIVVIVLVVWKVRKG